MMTETHLDPRIKIEDGQVKGLRIVDFNGHFWFGTLFHEFEDGYRHGIEHSMLL